MKTNKTTPYLYMIAILFNLPIILSCSADNVSDSIKNVNNEDSIQNLTKTDEEALLFMLKEEKLARDTYNFLDNTWSINQFANIKKSEQSHMDAIASLLTLYNIPYSVLPDGEFKNQNLQNLYNKFISEGTASISNALQIGATIEDLDIVDLQNNINITSNPKIIEVFERLQCGSRNHLKSFVNGIENNNDIYSPQFLSIDEYNKIIQSSHEKCGK